MVYGIYSNKSCGRVYCLKIFISHRLLWCIYFVHHVFKITYIVFLGKVEVFTLLIVLNDVGKKTKNSRSTKLTNS